MQENNTNNRTDGGGPTKIFDPFAIGPNHNGHSESTSIMELEESGKVFCPLCLEETPTRDLKEVDAALFNLYVFNLFEALDQHSENIQLRKIALPLLAIILRKRRIRIESDLRFHNILRTIHKVMKSDKFSCREFDQIAKIFSNISSYFIDSNPLPLISVWKASENLLNQATTKLLPTRNGSQEPAPTPYSFFGSLALIIKTYLMLLRRFTTDQVSDLIFPIYENDTVMTHNRSYYTASQYDCLQFMTNTLIPKCWPLLSTVDRLLEPEENIMAGEMFESLRECFELSLCLKNEKFLDVIMKLDCIHVAHSIIFRNPDAGLRAKIRSYLEKFIYHYIERYFESDEHLKDLKSHQYVVETNHKNAIVLASGSGTYRRSVFYLMANAVASKHESKYFNHVRIRKVLKSIQPDNLGIKNSVVFTRVYCYLAAKTIAKRSKFENVNNFITQNWRDLENSDVRKSLTDIYCYDDTVLLWVYDDLEFKKLLSVETVKYIIELNGKNGIVEKIINIISGLDCYKSLLQLYLKDDENSSLMIDKILQADQSNRIVCQDHREIVNKLSAMLPALLHDAVLDLNNQTDDLDNLAKIKRLLSMNTSMLRSCHHFDIILDEQFIIDLFKLIERMYGEETNSYDELLTIFNEFISLIIKTNNEALMRVIKYLNFNVLGYMFHRLDNTGDVDEFIESIARLFVTYDNLDYPLINNLVNDLFPESMSVVNWMMSQNEDLQLLAFRFAPKVLKVEIGWSKRACITAGFVQMIFRSPNLIAKRAGREHVASILRLESFRWSPLVRRIAHKLPQILHLEMMGSVESSEDILSQPSPAISFISSDDGIFEEEQISVTRILTQLNEEEKSDSSYRIPDSLFVSRSVEDQHSSTFDIEDWTRRALNST